LGGAGIDLFDMKLHALGYEVPADRTRSDVPIDMVEPSLRESSMDKGDDIIIAQAWTVPALDSFHALIPGHGVS
jgi:hypothetical protein